MNFADFQRTALDAWNSYLGQVDDAIQSGKMRVQDGAILFPNLILFTETQDHFLVELFGASEAFDGLTAKVHRERSTLRYLFQFDAEKHEPLLALDGRRHVLKTLALSRHDGFDLAINRFGTFDRWQSHLRGTFGCGSALGFGPAFKSAYIDDVLIVNSRGLLSRIKHVVHLGVISKRNMSEAAYLDDLQSLYTQRVSSTQDLYGILYAPGGGNGADIFTQFASMFLIPGVRETTIGEFLRQHPTFVNRAFSCDSFLYEPAFDWIDGSPSLDETSINPDIMPRRADGNYDIADIKTAALDRKSLTKGGHKRRRFVDVIQEGLAQLANYRDYFLFPANQQHARERHGVRVSNPTLTLVAGSYENLKREEVAEASRMLDPQFRVLDYDTLGALFVRSMIGRKEAD